MSHLEPSTLARYNSLTDPHLQSYFSNERIQTHLRHAGLVSRRGEILSDTEYRSKLAQREHRKHVQHMLAENIVNRAIDMERARNAEKRRQLDMVAKAALVNDVRESRRRGCGGGPGFLSQSIDVAPLSLNSSWSQARPRSANYHSDVDDYTYIQRVQSASTGVNRRRKSPAKSRPRRTGSRQRPKSSQRPQASGSYPDATHASPPCQITMVYYGPNTKVDYDRMVFSDADEVMVMQQHCGGENLIVYKNFLKPGAEFTFNSRRRADFPLGLSLYIKGMIDSRISTCCEYKHRHGVRLGGDRGHFAIVSVAGSKPCIKCRFEKDARLQRYARAPKDKKDKADKPMAFPLPASDEPKSRKTPIQIPVRHTSISSKDGSYDEDFDNDGKSDTRTKPIQDTNGYKPKVAPRNSRSTPKVGSEKSAETFDGALKPDSKKKTWQITFHPSNKATGNFQAGSNWSAKKFLLKFSFIARDGNDETESHEIDLKPFVSESKSARPHSFPIKLKPIGKPEQIRLRMLTTQDKDDDDDEEEEDIKWHLHHVEVIDPETQTHFIFPCEQWIRPQQEKYLELAEEYTSKDGAHKSPLASNGPKPSPPPKSKSRSSSESSSRSATPTPAKVIKPGKAPRDKSSSDNDKRPTPSKKPIQPRASARSSASSEDFKPAVRKVVSPPGRSSSNEETPRNDQKDLDARPRSSKAKPVRAQESLSDRDSSPIVAKLVQKPKTSLTSNSSKSNHKPVKSKQSYSSDEQDNDDTARTPQPTAKPKVGSPSSKSSNSSRAGKKTISPPKRRDSDENSDRSTPRVKASPPRRESPVIHTAPIRSTGDDGVPPVKDSPSDRRAKSKSPSFISMKDEEADYKTIFKQLDPDDELELGSRPRTPPTRPKTRRGRDDPVERRDSNAPMVPPLGLEGLTDYSARSHDPDHQPQSDQSASTQKKQHKHFDDDDDDE